MNNRVNQKNAAEKEVLVSYLMTESWCCDIFTKLMKAKCH